MSHLGNLCIFCWKILSSETFNELYTSVFLSCVFTIEPEQSEQPAALPQRLTSSAWPSPMHSSVLAFITAALLVEKLQHATLSKCQTKLLGREKCTLCLFFPHGLSCHFMNLKSKTSFLHKYPGKGIETITLLITRYRARKHGSFLTHVSDQLDREPCSKCSLSKHDFLIVRKMKTPCFKKT